MVLFESLASTTMPEAAVTGALAVVALLIAAPEKESSVARGVKDIVAPSGDLR